MSVFTTIWVLAVIYFTAKFVLEWQAAVTGVHKEYYPDGTIKCEIGWKHSRQKYLHGVYRTYYSNGKVEYESNIDRGTICGDSKAYYENGKLASVIHFENGIASGKSKYYSLDGRLALRVNYVMGFASGEPEIITEKGALILEDGIEGVGMAFMAKKRMTLQDVLKRNGSD